MGVVCVSNWFLYALHLNFKFCTEVTIIYINYYFSIKINAKSYTIKLTLIKQLSIVLQY